MKLYIINLIWSRQCWRPASSVSGRTPAVSSSAQVNGENVCVLRNISLGNQEEIFLKTLQDSESFPSSFPYALSQQLPGTDTSTPPLCTPRCNRLLSVCSAYKVTAISSQTRTWPQQPIHLGFFGDEILQDCRHQTSRRKCADYAASGRCSSTPPKALEWAPERKLLYSIIS